MRRTSVVLFGVCGLAAVAAAWMLWPTSRQRIDLDRELVVPPATPRPSQAPAPRTPRPSAAEVPIEAPSPPAAFDTGDSGAPAADIDYAEILPQIIDDPELRAEFEKMLNDPDPEVRREAEELVEIWLSE